MSNPGRYRAVATLFAASAIVLVACVSDVLFVNPYWSLFARIPTGAYMVVAIIGAVFGWVWANRVGRAKPVTSVLAGLAVSLAAVAVLIAWVPRIDQWTSERVAVAYQFTDQAVYRRVQPPHDQRRPGYFLLRDTDVAAYNQFLVMVIDGKLGTYVNFNTLVPLGKR